MSAVSFSMTKADKLANRPLKEGQIIFVEDTGKIYVDFHGKRTCYTPTSTQTIHYATDCVKFKGSSTTDPRNGVVTINGTSVLHPEENDLVLFNGGLFLYTNRNWIEFCSSSSGSSSNDPTWFYDEDLKTE